MVQMYKELIDAIHRAHNEYVTFARDVGIKSKLTRQEFMTIFMEYYKDYLDGGKTYGEDDDQRCQ